MARVRADWVRRQAGRELDTYLRQRAWHWTVRRNYALATDYAIRLLNRHPRDPLGLVLGELAGSRSKQDVFAEKCREAQRRLCFTKGVATPVELVRDGSSGAAAAAPCDASTGATSPTDSKTSALPSRSEVEALIEDATAWDKARTAAGAVTTGQEDEQIMVRESASNADMHAAVRRSCMRASSTQPKPPSLLHEQQPHAELLEPRGSVYGRGLYAAHRITPRTPLLTDEPFLVQRSDEHRCANCLQVAVPSATVKCPHCDEETYCSTSCQEVAWRTSHACCCRSVNPSFADWAVAMRDLLYDEPAGGSRVGDATVDSHSQARAALSCLAVAKLCAMATVQQVHPLALEGLRGLRGVADYEPATALSEIGALAVSLSATLRQPFLYMEEVLSLFALLQTNEFLLPGGVALYPVLSLLNHSCDPNCTLVRTATSGGACGGSGPGSDVRRTLIALRDIRDGEQLFIDYNTHLTSNLDYEQRKALCAQRHFECFCYKCVRKQ